jgi:peptide-methionine (S)-S-oxide reductase
MFEKLEGVISVRSGYQGGALKKPTYKQVCSGDTGHAEVVQVEYDPARVSYDQLLDLFWKMHDPTTLNRQGADVGTQYRSVIFYHTEAQREAAQRSLKALAASGVFDRPIVTEIKPAPAFYEAEGYHQDYYRKNPDAPYSRYIRGKLKKLDME